MLCYDSTEFYLQCAIKFVHEHENFRRKLPKENGGKDKGRKGEGSAWIFCPGAPEFIVTPLM